MNEFSCSEKPKYNIYSQVEWFMTQLIAPADFAVEILCKIFYVLIKLHIAM